jgi:hypothetical protein
MGGRSKSSPGSIPRETPSVGGAAHTGRSQPHSRVVDPERIPQSLDPDPAFEGRHTDKGAVRSNETLSGRRYGRIQNFWPDPFRNRN